MGHSRLVSSPPSWISGDNVVSDVSLEELAAARVRPNPLFVDRSSFRKGQTSWEFRCRRLLFRPGVDMCQNPELIGFDRAASDCAWGFHFAEGLRHRTHQFV